jgi:hypothetical protein
MTNEVFKFGKSILQNKNTHLVLHRYLVSRKFKFLLPQVIPQ